MSKTNIRSQYIKNLVADKESLSEQIKSNTKDTLRSILEDTVKDSLRDILNEDDDKEKDTFEVEDVEDTNTTDEPAEGTSDEPTSTDEPAEGEMPTDDANADAENGIESGETETPTDDIETPAEGEEMTDGEGEAGDEEMWNNLDKFKSENGEYDFTGMDNDSVIKVLKVMGPEDQIRVVKNDNGTVTLSDDETEREYVIDIEGTLTNGSENATSESNEETPMNEEGNLGYGIRQKNDAMTTPNMSEPAPNKVNDWDKGAPKGKERPFGKGPGDTAPFDKNVNEENDECKEGKDCIFEIDLECDPSMCEEPAMEEGVAGGARVHQMRKRPTNPDAEVRQPRNHTMNESYNNIVRKANTILAENAELKKIAEELKNQINEAVVINSSLAKVINLVTENSTTRAEKVSILERFDKVKTIEEGNALYETVARELKNTHPVNNGSNLINNQLNEAKQQPTETKLYKSDDLNETLNFWKRLEKVGK